MSRAGRDISFLIHNCYISGGCKKVWFLEWMRLIVFVEYIQNLQLCFTAFLNNSNDPYWLNLIITNKWNVNMESSFQLCLIWLSLLMRLWFSYKFQRAKNVGIMLWKAFWLFHSNIFCVHKVEHLCHGAGEPIKELVTAIPLHVMSSHYNTDHLKQI